MTCPRCQQENLPTMKFCWECGAPLKRGHPAPASSADLTTEVENLSHALGEVQEQQTATSEALKVISRSTFDLTPVLQTLVEHATRLCTADVGMIRRPDGEMLRPVAAFRMPSELNEFDQRIHFPPDVELSRESRHSNEADQPGFCLVTSSASRGCMPGTPSSSARRLVGFGSVAHLP